MRGRLLGGIALLLAAGGAAWLAYPSGPGETDPGGGAPKSAAPVPVVSVAPSERAPGVAAPAATPLSDGVVHGTVTLDGKPVAARVFAWRHGLPQPSSHTPNGWRPDAMLDGFEDRPRAVTESGPDGRWSFRGLAPGQYQFDARCGEARGSQWEEVRPDGSLEFHGPVPANPLNIFLKPSPCDLRGRVLRADGAPFAGLVHVGPASHDESCDAPPPVRAGADGSFHLTGLQSGTIALRAVEPGKQRYDGPIVLLPIGEPVIFTVGAGEREVEGRVVADSGGAPVQGARIFTYTGGHAGQRLTSGFDGRFRFRSRLGKPTEFTVDADGFLQGGATYFDDPDSESEPLEIELVRPATLSGTVTVEGTGAPASRVRIVAASLQWDTQVAETDAEGRYSFRNMGEGRVVVLVTGGEFVSRVPPRGEPWDLGPHSASLEYGGSATLDLVVAPAPRIRGRVLDGSGAAVSGMSVAISADDDTIQDPADEALPESATVPVGPDGSFDVALPLPGMSYEVSALREGRREAVAVVPSPAPGTVADVVLRLPPSRSVEVLVVDRDSGAPVEGARVEARAAYGSRDSTFVEGEWKSGPDGRVTVSPLPAVRAELTAWRDVDGESESGESLEIGPDETGPVVLESIPPEPAGTLSISGVVLMPDGSPAAGALVNRTRSGEIWLGANHPGDGYRADFRGMFRLQGLRPGRWSVRAEISDGERQLASDLDADAGTEGLVFRLRDWDEINAGLTEETPGHQLRLRVSDPEGNPVEGAVRIFLSDSGGFFECHRLSLFEGACAAPVPEGGTRFAWVEVGPDSEWDEERPLAADVFGPFPAVAGEIPIRIEPARTFEARFVDPDGKGVSGVKVSLDSDPRAFPRGGHGSLCESRGDTGPEGLLRLNDLGSGAYEMTVETGTDWIRPAPITVRAGGETRTVVLRRASTVRVRVLDADGKPVPDAEVWACSPPQRRSLTSRTDASGVAALQGLDPAASYRLDAWSRERDDTLRVSMDSWTPADGEVRLGRAWSLEVRVRDTVGRPLDGVSVEAAWDSGGERGDESHAVTQADGRATLTRLGATRVSVKASFPERDGDEIRPEVEVEATAGAGPLEMVFDSGPEAVFLLPRDLWRNRTFDIRITEDGTGRVCARGEFEEGRFRARALRAGAAHTVACTDGQRLTTILRGFVPGGPPVRLALAEGRTLQGRVLLREGERVARVSVLFAGSALLDSDHVGADGAFEIRAVPEGPLQLEAAIADRDHHVREVHVDARPDAPVVIDAR